MAYVNFYLDKPFNPAKDKKEIKTVIADCNATRKHYPKSILNSQSTSLYLYFTPEIGTRIKQRTNIKILPEHWDFGKGKYKSSIAGSIELNNELENISAGIRKQYLRYCEENEILTPKEIKTFLHRFLNGNISTQKSTISRVKVIFLEKKKGLLTDGTLKEYRTIFKSLSDYEQIKNVVLDFNSFNQSFFEEYERFLINKDNGKEKGKGLLNDTIAKYTATLKTFIQWAYEEGIHKNAAGFTNIKTSIKKRSKNDIVALTEEEIFTLLNYDFSENKRLERVRDLFCFGCFTGQRFSDIMNFNLMDFDGQKWDFVSLKNKKRVIVPMSGFIANALLIIEKYDGNLPVITNQKFNDYLKEIGELAQINSPVKIIRYRGIERIVIQKPKFEFMSSHMARRSFVTISLEKGVPITIVQKITQHADLRTLIKYEGHNSQALFNLFKNT